SSTTIFLSVFPVDPVSPTDILTLSLHDALPIFIRLPGVKPSRRYQKQSCHNCHWWNFTDRQYGNAFSSSYYGGIRRKFNANILGDRKSTRLNSSHVSISYAVFCLKKNSTFRVLF